MSWMEVTVLVDKAKEGDRQAYGELVRRFQQSVELMALAKVKNALEAQELAQEVFVHAMRKLPQLRDSRCFGGWLRQITARMALNRLTRKGPFLGAEPETLDGFAGPGRGPVEALELSEAKGELHAGLEKLKPADREILELFYLRERSLKQIGRGLEIPVGTVKRRLHVARHRLKAVLEGKKPAARRRALAGV